MRRHDANSDETWQWPGVSFSHNPNESACSRESGEHDPISLAGRLERHPVSWGEHDHEVGWAWPGALPGMALSQSLVRLHQTPLGVLDCHDRFPGLHRLFRITARSSAWPTKDFCDCVQVQIRGTSISIGLSSQSLYDLDRPPPFLARRLLTDRRAMMMSLHLSSVLVLVCLCRALRLIFHVGAVSRKWGVNHLQRIG
jgi:hypothetical protein